MKLNYLIPRAVFSFFERCRSPEHSLSIGVKGPIYFIYRKSIERCQKQKIQIKDLQNKRDKQSHKSSSTHNKTALNLDKFFIKMKSNVPLKFDYYVIITLCVNI